MPGPPGSIISGSVHGYGNDTQNDKKRGAMAPDLLLTLAMTVHFVADFLLQTDWMATNKSKRWDALALHCAVYSVCFLPFGLTFAAALFGLHFMTDAVTSRITSRLWFFKCEDGIWEQASYTVPKHGRTLVNPFTPSIGNRHWFFVVIGFDQWLHLVQLWWLLKVFHG